MDTNRPLSPRERECLVLMRQGLGDKQIARELGCCVTTVKAHLGRSYRKLGVSGRSEYLAAELHRLETGIGDRAKALTRDAHYSLDRGWVHETLCRHRDALTALIRHE